MKPPLLLSMRFRFGAGLYGNDINAYVQALTDPVDCIVLGRKLAEGNSMAKVVVSHSLTESPWENTVVAGGGLAETVNKLKAQPGGDLITYGGGTLVANLIAGGLVDELHLFVNPTAIGAGMPVFPKGDAYQQPRLVAAQTFDCGITALHYEPRRS